MAKSIKDLREEKGFRSAKEFSSALGIAASSMSRYDRQPDIIPIKHAWAMADLLECSIDEVVGREHVTSGVSGLQEIYDGLLPENRGLVDEFIEFVQAKDAKARQQMRAEEDGRYDGLCQFYERMFDQSLYASAEFGELVTFDSPIERREAFEGFLREKAAEKRKPGIDLHCEGLEEELRGGWLDADGVEQHYTEQQIQTMLIEERVVMDKEFGEKDEEVIGKVMEAYDRQHGRELRNWAVHSGKASPEQVVRYASIRMPD